jgi:uncharacterized membrane protein
MVSLWYSGVPNFTGALTNFLAVAAGFPECVVVAGLPGSLVTEEKTIVMAATLAVVAGIAELG